MDVLFEIPVVISIWTTGYCVVRFEEMFVLLAKLFRSFMEEFLVVVENVEEAKFLLVEVPKFLVVEALLKFPANSRTLEDEVSATKTNFFPPTVVMADVGIIIVSVC